MGPIVDGQGPACARAVFDRAIRGYRSSHRAHAVGEIRPIRRKKERLGTPLDFLVNGLLLLIQDQFDLLQ